MMPGIVSYGAYIPFYRLSPRGDSAGVGRCAGVGRKGRRELRRRQSHHGRGCRPGLPGGPGPGPRRRALFCVDHGPLQRKAKRGHHRRRVGPGAGGSHHGLLRLAPERVKCSKGGPGRGDSGSARSILVCAADMRLGYPSGPGEMNFGDGAAALLVGRSETIADVEHFDTSILRNPGHWRSDKDTFVRSAEDRFAMEEGYQ